MTPALAARNIACRRGDRVLFKRLDMTLAAGDLVHVTGANGTGKSSLMRILAGLLRPYAGQIDREGTIGLVDERLSLDPEWPLGRALKFWERLDGCTDAAHAITAMELEGLLDVPVRFLSTGQRKRAAFARLLSSPKDIWLLDEPLNGLDDAARSKVEALVTKHCAAGGMGVIASHQSLQVDARIIAL
ncbi:heme ABC exporter ATP-binding protein CcmA, partial [Altererythrobacter sp.]|nr:heme ABC exporter ATP-binding protein CcmA [Altererythrobacter sp.]